MTLSVIIPALNEAAGIGPTVTAVAALRPLEILVVDGGSRDDTAARAASAGARVLVSPPGRARQMNAGAAHARGEVLLFLHADARLPSTALDDVSRALAAAGTVGGRFTVRLDHPGLLYRVIETGMNARSRLSGIVTGDQALFLTRRAFEALGGYAEIPLMEDIELSRRVKRIGRLACLDSVVLASARRWERQGPWRTILLMWTLRALYALGVSPTRLARAYAPVR